MSQRNKMIFGVIGGLLLPFVISFFYYKAAFDQYSFNEFFQKAVELGVHTELLSLSVIPNLLLFFIFVWSNRLYHARGVLLATFVYAFFMMALKFA